MKRIFFALVSLIMSSNAFTQFNNSDYLQLADEIYCGRVATTKSFWNEARTLIVSEISIKVDRRLNGNSTRPVEKLTIAGGKVDDVALTVTHVPNFIPGEFVIIFRLTHADKLPRKFKQRDDFDAMLLHKYSFPNRSAMLETATALKQELLDQNNSAVEILHSANIIRIDPPYCPAGIGQTIKIMGTGFGNGDNSSVDFFRYFSPWENDSLWVASNKNISWTDSFIECVVPSDASSGAIRIYQDGQPGESHPFEVPFSYGGMRWKGNYNSFKYRTRWGTNVIVVPYEVNDNSDYSPAIADVVNAALTWNRSGHALVQLRYAGQHSSDHPEFDGHNRIFWDPMASHPWVSTTYLWHTGDELIEADIALNWAFYYWQPFPGYCDVPAMVTRNVVMHELGHLAGCLADLYGKADARKTMYGMVLEEEIKAQTLAPEDVRGMQWIYGAGLQPDFFADQKFSTKKRSVQFTDQTKSKFQPVAWEWHFGDGKKSFAQNPIHDYPKEGENTYQVSLTVRSEIDTAVFEETVTKKITLETYHISSQFDAEPTIGYWPLTVNFKILDIDPKAKQVWDFGDGTTSTQKEPVHTYEQPGVYSVTLKTITADCTQLVTAPGIIEVYDDIHYVGLTQLHFLEGTPCYSESEGWDNAVDRDTYQFSGTVNAGRDEIPQAIFEFDDHSTKKICRLRMMCDTGVPHKIGDWVTEFSLFVSKRGVAESDFSFVGRFENTRGSWNDFSFEPMTARYLKFVIHQPSFGWRQIGEIEVYEKIEGLSALNCSVEVSSPHVANGLDPCLVTIHVTDAYQEPVSGLPSSAFKIATDNVEENLQQSDFPVYYIGDVVADSVVASDVAGVYYSKLTSILPAKKQVIVRIYDISVDADSLVEFTTPDIAEAELQFINGTITWPNEGWDNAIDDDIEGEDGTVSAGPLWRDCYGIFQFADGRIRPILNYRLITETGIPFNEHLVTEYEVWVSTTGIKKKDFSKIHYWERQSIYWEQFFIQPVFAKFIKLILLQPKYTWRQIGEFEVFTTTSMVDTISGTPAIAAETQSISAVPMTFALKQNYPNPFNPETTIEFQLPVQCDVTIDIYNVIGQYIRTLVDASYAAGTYKFHWDGKDDFQRNVGTGIYFYKMTASGADERYSQIRKMVLLR